MLVKNNEVLATDENSKAADVAGDPYSGIASRKRNGSTTYRTLG